MERESFEDPADRGADERALRLREGRPRGAPRRRRALHGGRAGDDRPRRLAAERVRHARAGAVLRRHVLPARAAPGHAARGARCSARSPRRGRPRSDEIRGRASGWPQRLQGGALLAPSDEPTRPRRARRRRSRALRARVRQRQRRLRRARRSSRRRRRSSSCCARGERRDVALHAARRWPRAASTTRSAAASRATRSTRPGPSRTSRRCSTTTRCSRAPTCTAGRSRATRCCGATAEETLDWALREMRGAGGRLLQRARRRLRGRRGQVLRVDARRAARAPSATDADAAIAWFGATDAAATSRAPNVLEARGPEPPARACASASARGCSRSRARARAPGLDDKRLTSWNALMIAALAEAGARAASAPDYARRRARAAADFLLDAHARRRTGACCARCNGRRGAPERLPRGPRVPARGAARPLRGDVRGALVRRGARDRRRDRSRASPTTSSGGFFSTSDDHEALVARRKDLEDAPIPSGALERRARPAAARARSPARRAYEERAPVAPARCCTRSRRGTRRRSAHLLQALDFHLAADARGRARRRAATASRARARRARARAARTSCSRAAAARATTAVAADGRPRAGRRPRGRVRLRALRLSARR